MSAIVYNHYQILGVSEYASAEDIRAAYKSLAKKYHPDKHGGQLFYEEHFKKINEAYQILSDPQKRARYDLQRQYRYTAPSQRPSAHKQHARQRRQYQQAAPPKPEGLTISQLKNIAYVFAGLVVFGFLIVQLYTWMNKLTAADYIEKGIRLEQEGLYSAAYESFVTALDFEPENSKAWFHKGVLAHEHLKNNTAAILAFNSAIEFSENHDWQLYYYKGICHLEEREADNAIFSFNNALRQAGCPDSLYDRLGDAYFIRNDHNKALDAYTVYLSKHPGDIETLIKRGLCHHKLNHMVLSMKDYEKAIELDPDNAAAYFYRSQLKFASGDRKGGIIDLDTSASFQYRRAIRVQNEIRNQERLDSIMLK